MKAGRKLNEVMAELDRQGRAKKDYIGPAQAFRLREDGRTFEISHAVSGQQEVFGTNQLFHRQVASALNIPAKYYDLMQSQKPDLLAKNVNAWFGSRENSYMIRSMDYGSGRVARALLSERYRRIDNLEVAAAVLPLFAGRGEYEVVSAEVTENRLYLMFILYGATSRNGKGTTMETFLKIMGDYGKTSNPEMLSTKFGNTNASGPSEEIARLAGIRFVNISEPEKKITFNAALVKRLTGNDTINARYLHENSFDFRPVFKIFINTNYLPNVSDMTLFDSGRLKIIPFKRHFEEAEQDKGLKALFAEEENLSGIFNWCLEGYKGFRNFKLASPNAVVEAIQDYRKDSDRIGQFIEAWLEAGETYEVRTSAAYYRYRKWCEKYGYNSENMKNFNNAMSRYFEVKRKRPKEGGSVTTMIVGCRFLEAENGEEDADPEVLEDAKMEFRHV